MQRYFAKGIINGEIILENSDIHHIKTVMRMKENEKIEVVYDKELYICNIECIDDLKLKIDYVVNESNELSKEIMDTGLTPEDVAKTVKYVFDLPHEITIPSIEVRHIKNY